MANRCRLAALLLFVVLLSACSASTPLLKAEPLGTQRQAVLGNESADSAEDDKVVAQGVEGSLRASLRGAMLRYKDESKDSDSREQGKNTEPGELKFMVCSTDYDYERKVAISNCSMVTP